MFFLSLFGIVCFYGALINWLNTAWKEINMFIPHNKLLKHCLNNSIVWDIESTWLVYHWNWNGECYDFKTNESAPLMIHLIKEQKFTLFTH